MYWSIWNSQYPRTFELSSLGVVKFPTLGPKICSNAPCQGWIQWSNAPPPVHSSSESPILFGLKYPFPAFFQNVTNRNVMSSTLNIDSPMITEGSGSSFCVWRQTRCFYAQCATKHQIEGTNQIPHPSGVVVKCPTPGTLRSIKFPLSPGKGKGQMPGVCPGGNVQVSN